MQFGASGLHSHGFAALPDQQRNLSQNRFYTGWFQVCNAALSTTYNTSVEVKT